MIQASDLLKSYTENTAPVDVTLPGGEIIQLRRDATAIDLEGARDSSLEWFKTARALSDGVLRNALGEINKEYVVRAALIAFLVVSDEPFEKWRETMVIFAIKAAGPFEMLWQGFLQAYTGKSLDEMAAAIAGKVASEPTLSSE